MYEQVEVYLPGMDEVNEAIKDIKDQIHDIQPCLSVFNEALHDISITYSFDDNKQTHVNVEGIDTLFQKLNEIKRSVLDLEIVVESLVQVLHKLSPTGEFESEHQK